MDPANGAEGQCVRAPAVRESALGGMGRRERSGFIDLL